MGAYLNKNTDQILLTLLACICIKHNAHFDLTRSVHDVQLQINFGNKETGFEDMRRILSSYAKKNLMALRYGRR